MSAQSLAKRLLARKGYVCASGCPQLLRQLRAYASYQKDSHHRLTLTDFVSATMWYRNPRFENVGLINNIVYINLLRPPRNVIYCEIKWVRWRPDD